MSLFPAVLLALSLLGLIGQYPETYDAILGYLRDVAPRVGGRRRSTARCAARCSTRAPRRPRSSISVAVALYGTTGVLEAARRALNVVFEVDGGRSFVRRKVIDVGVHGRADGARPRDAWSWPSSAAASRRTCSGFIGLGPDGRATSGTSPAGPRRSLIGDARLRVHLLRHARRPAALVPLGHAGRGRRRAALARRVVRASRSTSRSVADVGAVYGAFAGAIVLVGWLWLTNVALLLRRRAQRGDRAREGARRGRARSARRSTGRRGAAEGCVLSAGYRCDTRWPGAAVQSNAHGPRRMFSDSLADALVPPVHGACPAELKLHPGVPLDLGVEFVEHRSHVAAVVGVRHAPNDLHVLLRHRPPSIPRRGIA